MKAKALGYRGEELAAQYLQSKGYILLRHNFTIRGGEIDLIAQHGKTLVFVEVKTRTAHGFGEGSESITYSKKLRLLRAIERFLGDRDIDYRMDVIEIDMDAENSMLKQIQHFEDIEL